MKVDIVDVFIGILTLIFFLILFLFIIPVSFLSEEGEEDRSENSLFELKAKERIGGNIYRIIEHKETGKMFIMNTSNGNLILLK